MAAGQDFAAGLEKVMFPDDEQQQPFTRQALYPRDVTSSVGNKRPHIPPFWRDQTPACGGNSAIKKELEEALEGSSVADAARAPLPAGVCVCRRRSGVQIFCAGLRVFAAEVHFLHHVLVPSSPSVCDDDEDVSSIPPDPESNWPSRSCACQSRPACTRLGRRPAAHPIRRALKVARGLAVMLPEAGEAEWLPTAEALAATGIDRTVTTREWDFALAVLVASVSRTQHLVRRIAEGYATLVLACARHDATFFARTRTHNPDYAGCQTPEMMASKARIKRHADGRDGAEPLLFAAGPNPASSRCSSSRSTTTNKTTTMMMNKKKKKMEIKKKERIGFYFFNGVECPLTNSIPCMTCSIRVTPKTINPHISVRTA